MRISSSIAMLVLPLGGQSFLTITVSSSGENAARRVRVGENEESPIHSSSPLSREKLVPAVRDSWRLPLARAVPEKSSPVAYIMSLFGGSGAIGSKAKAAQELEAKLLLAIEGVEGRGRDVTQEQRALVDKAVETLEEDGGVTGAASSPIVDGGWRLIFTTTPGTASPVQRSFVGVDTFAIYQDIDLFSETEPPTVTNVVDFGPRVGQLRVTALASTSARPMEGFVPRQGDGRFFGFNIIGVSQTTPPKDPSARIDFQFDQAGFDFKALPFNIPYPVPFRWLGDEVKGWIDVTYLSERLRIARGNKGTLFVLQRAPQSRPSPSAETMR
ncbi:unnamed protein product [Ascophyllum nodosum]